MELYTKVNNNRQGVITMNIIRQFENSFIEMSATQMVEAMKVLDPNKMKDIYWLISMEILEIDELEKEFNSKIVS